MADKFINQSVGRLYDVANRIRHNPNESLTAAARAEHTTPRTIKRLNRELQLFELKHSKPGTRYDIGFNAERTITFIDEDGIVHENTAVDKRSASNYSKYIFSLRDATRFGGSDAEFQRRANIGVRDVYGTKYKLASDIDTFFAVLDSEELSFDDLFYPKK